MCDTRRVIRPFTSGLLRTALKLSTTRKRKRQHRNMLNLRGLGVWLVICFFESFQHSLLGETVIGSRGRA